MLLEKSTPLTVVEVFETSYAITVVPVFSTSLSPVTNVSGPKICAPVPSPTPPPIARRREGEKELTEGEESPHRGRGTISCAAMLSDDEMNASNSRDTRSQKATGIGPMPR